jgi:hypothetical protein
VYVRFQTVQNPISKYLIPTSTSATAARLIHFHGVYAIRMASCQITLHYSTVNQQQPLIKSSSPTHGLTSHNQQVTFAIQCQRNHSTSFHSTTPHKVFSQLETLKTLA